jgi:hypothetical protein
LDRGLVVRFGELGFARAEIRQDAAKRKHTASGSYFAFLAGFFFIGAAFVVDFFLVVPAIDFDSPLLRRVHRIAFAVH